MADNCVSFSPPFLSLSLSSGQGLIFLPLAFACSRALRDESENGGSSVCCCARPWGIHSFPNCLNLPPPCFPSTSIAFSLSLPLFFFFLPDICTHLSARPSGLVFLGWGLILLCKGLWVGRTCIVPEMPPQSGNGRTKEDQNCDVVVAEAFEEDAHVLTWYCCRCHSSVVSVCLMPFSISPADETTCATQRVPEKGRRQFYQSWSLSLSARLGRDNFRFPASSKGVKCVGRDILHFRPL